ncbi:hypothetical protein NQZ68_014805 [Dissostichus eleginoides]|nr:hypothetical protein NQZ68_014805 [Dissostichus eleginoides]
MAPKARRFSFWWPQPPLGTSYLCRLERSALSVFRLFPPISSHFAHFVDLLSAREERSAARGPTANIFQGSVELCFGRSEARERIPTQSLPILICSCIFAERRHFFLAGAGEAWISLTFDILLAAVASPRGRTQRTPPRTDRRRSEGRFASILLNYVLTVGRL